MLFGWALASRQPEHCRTLLVGGPEPPFAAGPARVAGSPRTFQLDISAFLRSFWVCGTWRSFFFVAASSRGPSPGLQGLKLSCVYSKYLMRKCGHPLPPPCDPGLEGR